MELSIFSWNTFVNTGDIEAYLLYKSTEELKKNGKEDAVWQTSEPKA